MMNASHYLAALTVGMGMWWISVSWPVAGAYAAEGPRSAEGSLHAEGSQKAQKSEPQTTNDTSPKTHKAHKKSAPTTTVELVGVLKRADPLPIDSSLSAKGSVQAKDFSLLALQPLAGSGQNHDQKGEKLCPGQWIRKLLGFTHFTVQVQGQRRSHCLRVKSVTFLKNPRQRPLLVGILRKANKHYEISSIASTSSENSQQRKTDALDSKIYRFKAISPTLQSYVKDKRKIMLEITADMEHEGFSKILSFYTYPD